MGKIYFKDVFENNEIIKEFVCCVWNFLPVLYRKQNPVTQFLLTTSAVNGRQFLHILFKTFWPSIFWQYLRFNGQNKKFDH